MKETIRGPLSQIFREADGIGEEQREILRRLAAVFVAHSFAWDPDHCLFITMRDYGTLAKNIVMSQMGWGRGKLENHAAKSLGLDGESRELMEYFLGFPSPQDDLYEPLPRKARHVERIVDPRRAEGILRRRESAMIAEDIVLAFLALARGDTGPYRAVQRRARERGGFLEQRGRLAIEKRILDLEDWLIMEATGDIGGGRKGAADMQLRIPRVQDASLIYPLLEMEQSFIPLSALQGMCDRPWSVAVDEDLCSDAPSHGIASAARDEGYFEAYSLEPRFRVERAVAEIFCIEALHVNGERLTPESFSPGEPLGRIANYRSLFAHLGSKRYPAIPIGTRRDYIPVKLPDDDRRFVLEVLFLVTLCKTTLDRSMDEEGDGA